MSTIGPVLAYLATKADFLQDAPSIAEIVRESVQHHLGVSIARGSPEYSAWQNSLGNAMFHVMNGPEIPASAGVAVEYRINGRRQRIDFLIAGSDDRNTKNVVIIELKQWSAVEASPLRDCVRTFVGHATRDVVHPSYQAWSYARQLLDFYEVINTDNIGVHPCAYVHNCDASGPLVGSGLAPILARAPLFLQGDYLRLRSHIASKIQAGPGKAVLEAIDRSAIRPGKQLVEALSAMLDGNEEFTLVDEQKVTLEQIVDLSRRTAPGRKSVMLVKGGPGTGKSLIAVNGMVRLSQEGLNVRYVTKNAAPRRVYERKLQGRYRTADIREMFVTSDAFRDAERDAFDVLLVDEAHRLPLQGGLYGNLGENQVREIIRSARTSVFFVDEDQMVTWRDVGSVTEIERCAADESAALSTTELSSQFRCAGAEEYMSWLDATLGLVSDRPTALPSSSFDFRVLDDPEELRELIVAKNRINNRSRLVAGYCWNWVSRRDPLAYDIQIPGSRFKMRWNLASDGSTWMIEPHSVDQVGCIHTAQGLECDYVGVIIGPDLVGDGDSLRTDPFARARTDQSLKGFKRDYQLDPEAALHRADRLIRNTYMTLMSRGMSGCYVFCTDEGARDYLRRSASAQLN